MQRAGAKAGEARPEGKQVGTPASGGQSPAPAAAGR